MKCIKGPDFLLAARFSVKMASVIISKPARQYSSQEKVISRKRSISNIYIMMNYPIRLMEAELIKKIADQKEKARGYHRPEG